MKSFIVYFFRKINQKIEKMKTLFYLNMFMNVIIPVAMFVFGTFSNLIVFLVYIRKQFKKNPRNFFCVLALNDIFSLFSCKHKSTHGIVLSLDISLSRVVFVNVDGRNGTRSSLSASSSSSKSIYEPFFAAIIGKIMSHS